MANLASILLTATLLFHCDFSSAQSVLCDRFTVEDLGSTTMITDAGDSLLPAALSPLGEEVTRIPARVINYNIVCDATGSMRNTSSFVSVVVEFVCMSTSSSPSLQDCDGSTRITRQYQFRCGTGNVWIETNLGNGVETLNPTATLSTPTADRCVSCVDDDQSFINPVTHCSDCPSNINCNQGQRRCYQGPIQDQCCNYYMDNACVASCPAPFVGDAETFDCGCGQLSLDNGVVTYTARFVVDSVAMYACNTGYRREGNYNRTCTSSGWDGQDVTCVYIQCRDLVGTLENGEVTISSTNRSLGSKATYTCDSDYELTGGDSQRNCQMDSTWDGTAPKCNKKSGPLHPGIIAAIAIAGVLFILGITAATLITIIALVTKKGEKQDHNEKELEQKI